MNNTRISLNSVIENQLPLFVRENFPLVEEFLRDYYKTLDLQGGVNDILQNIDKQIKVDNSSNTIDSTILESKIGFNDNIVEVQSTEGFPNFYGIIKIDSEIILYKNKTNTSFNECIRGFSAITEYSSGGREDFVFEDTLVEAHSSGSLVTNLSALFLKEFFKKTKKQFLPGFEDRSFYSELNISSFLKQSKDFYSSKGTDESFKILFRVLFGAKAEIIKPRDFLIQSSDAQYRLTKNIVVEEISGDVRELVNKTIFQDEQGTIPKSFATVNEIEPIFRNGKHYYILKLDFDFNKDINVFGSIFGEFSIHPKTKIIENVPVGSDSIIVDSTVGFPKSGTLIYSGLAKNILITYQDKTLTQFINCSGITEELKSGNGISQNVYAYGYSKTNEEIRFRIGGVLNKDNIGIRGSNYSKDDTGKIVSFGYDIEEDFKSNNWLFNVSVDCEVSRIVDDSGFNYTVFTFDNANIYDKDKVEIDYLSNSSGRKIREFTVSVADQSIPGKQFQIKNVGESVDKIFSVRKVISKYNDLYPSDTINVYKDTSSNSVFVSSNSLPNYGESQILVEDFKIEISKVVDDIIYYENHGYLTGDAVLYTFNEENSQENRLNVESGSVFFVKVIDENNFKISRSKENIALSEENLNFNGYVNLGTVDSLTNNFISLLRFASPKNVPDSIEPQKIVRKLQNPTIGNSQNKTKKGTTGIFLNGVELLNYKSRDVVYYGDIKEIEVLGQGSNYDVINPPTLEISPGIGTTVPASGYCGLEGSLFAISIIDPGFDYIENPTIDITGGGGSGASAKANLIPVENIINFDSSSENSKIKPGNTFNEIGFGTFHRLSTGEIITYSSNNQQLIGGLEENSDYYVKIVDDFSIQLFSTRKDSIDGTNPIDITGFGEGTHTIKSKQKKFTVGSISILDSGSGYKNKKITVNPSGINTAFDLIEVYDHPYQSGEIITYDCQGSVVSGLSTGSYYVTRIDSKKFKLSEIGVGSTEKDFFYKTKQYINLKTPGSGKHIFNYEPINLSIKGYIGVSTSNQKEFNATLKPIFRGSVTSVFVEDGGVGYGSSDIINYNRQPSITLNSGSGAKAIPIISNGKIVEVLIKNSGSGYVSTPDIFITGSGVGAILTPIIENKTIKEIKVISGGFGYDPKDTLVNIVSPGSGCKLNTKIKTWTINNFERLISSGKIGPDGGVSYRGLNPDYGLQYTHLYPPKDLRTKLFSVINQDDEIIYRADYFNDTNTTKYHSPIIGWAYDGNPIYGPYGYKNQNSKIVKQLLSGYANPVDNLEGRPGKTVFPAGFFIEDYEYTGEGDLDENNGRFCVTPEFPNGTYAYFSTIEESVTNKKGIFNGQKKPKFPYVIGSSFKSKPIDFNFSISSNQDDFNFLDPNLIRNTNPYNSRSSNSTYRFIENNNKNYKVKDSKIVSTYSGGIDGITIISGGDNYSVGDIVDFVGGDLNGSKPIYTVDKISGKDIDQISLSSLFFEDVEFIPYKSNSKIIGFTTIPHTLLSNDTLLAEPTNNFKLRGSFKVNIPQNTLVLSVGVGSLSDVDYFQVSGDIKYPEVVENDVFKIESEEIKVLNVEPGSSRIRVLRGFSGTEISSHVASTVLVEKSNKIIFDYTSQNLNSVANREYYFDPKESLGIGTVGLLTTFSNPGSGVTSLTIPSRSIYLKNHNIESGTLVVYNSNGGDTISVSTDGTSSFTLTNGDRFYTTKITEDFVGLSTERIGISTTGEYLNSDGTIGLLYFNGIGTSTYHSIKTLYNNTLKANITKNSALVSTATTHNLSLNDTVYVDVSSGLSTSYKVKYNDYYRRLIVGQVEFLSSDVDQNNSTIRIPAHNFKNGQKIIFNSSSNYPDLVDNEIYYISVYDRNRIRLSRSKYDSNKKIPNFIGITTTILDGSISPINLPLSIVRNKKIVFDVSDESLSIESNSKRIPSFDINFYKDFNLSERLFIVDSQGISKIVKTGTVGVDSTAKIELLIDSSFPDIFYYSLEPIQRKTNTNIKKEYKIDNEVDFRNSILLQNSKFSGTHKISGVGTDTFNYTIGFTNEIETYNQSNSSLSYDTNSKSEKGIIRSFKSLSKGYGYNSFPSISSVFSESGSGAILVPNSNKIGKIKSLELQDIGYDYSIDSTIRPRVKFPTVLRVEPLSKINFIGISSIGLYYNTEPTLVVLDGFTNQVVNDLVLDFDQKNYTIKIIKNSKGFYNVTPRIIPVQNTNGVGISSISYNNSNKEVTVTFNREFPTENEFPFNLNDKILIEGISILESSGIGYNSKNYNYQLFTVKEISSAGPNPTLKYSLENYLTGSQIPGTFDSENSSGSIIPEKYFPIFDVELIKNSFSKGEIVKYGNKTGKVLNWDSNNEILKIETAYPIKDETIIEGFSSGTKGTIKENLSYEDYYTIKSSSIVKNGWKDSVGFLNNSLQRIADNDYYQYFSYSVKSEVPIEDWKNAVNDLNHTVGFKNFGDLQVVSSTQEFSGITTSQQRESIDISIDLNSEVDINCTFDYDLVRENSFYIDNVLSSDEIFFDSRIIQDYSESVGNRVLLIDDISDQFNTSLPSTFVTSFNI